MFVNLYHLPRGTICVLRHYRGELIALQIQVQARYQEWSGAFCII